MDKGIWREKYDKNGFAAFPCPKCGTGKLRRVKDRTFEQWKSEADADPTYTEGKFACFLECTAGHCKAVAVMSGLAVSVYEPYIDPDGKQQMDENIYFHPRNMLPGAQVIAVPNKTPKAVAAEISKSFGLIWTDRSSAANKLRNAVEEILVDHGVPKLTIKGGFIPLAKRLEEAEKKQMLHHDTLVALKDVGNTGSHETELPLKDLLDAYDILEDALEDIYGGRRARLQGIRDRLTKKKGKAP
ncbi:MAG: DUF4145 domain-containing protein [Mesorhizobium sp.]|uniref:DUF4145 domain-containing protein n=1 Tax=Mesorhizobium sp. TaxID=1871066 RepID=UPI001212767E|nr:DUF4145 domain-containing protein [Mesorhizobium sp.]TIP27037.1 MAG: DUF4145 domain-containing protein [Mesorhizobium sp.]